jgi:hypothetical protein
VLEQASTLKRDLRHRRKSLVGGAQSLPYFARGYRYAQRLPAPAVPLPAPAAEDAGVLETYFNELEDAPAIYKWQHYFPIYERHIQRFRGKPVRLVEVGIQFGGSLHMWRQYFGPETVIYGIDINPRCLDSKREGVEIILGDQGDPAFWESFLADSPTFDIVIDDGGHLAHQQAVTLAALLPHIRPGGVYICEDIHGPFQPFASFVDGLTHRLNDVGTPGAHTPASTLHQHVASIHHYPLLTVIEKPTEIAPTFEADIRGTIKRAAEAAPLRDAVAEA